MVMMMTIVIDLPIALQSGEWNGCMIFGHTFDQNIHLECFVEFFVVMIISLHTANEP